MQNRSEESEWTRFSRALGGTPPPPPPRDTYDRPADEPGDAPTLAQLPAETEAYLPSTANEPEADEAPVQTYTRSAVHAPVRATVSRTNGAEGGETVVGEGANFEGTLRSDRSIRVHGSVQGEIESTQQVVIEQGARIQARVSAGDITVFGEVNGAIACNGRVEIAAGARVTGEVTAGTLVIEEGAFFEGSLRMSSNQVEA